MMVVFPILMILILSFAFKSSFNTAATVPKLTICYQLEGKETEYQKNFITFLKLLNKELHLEAKETKDIAKAKQRSARAP